MFERSHDALESLHQRGLLNRGQIDVVAIQKQMDAYVSLSERSSGTSTTRSFLAEYDALMRLVEVILICSEFRIGPQPHRVLKDVINAMTPDSRIHDICDARHKAKKFSVEPPAELRSRLSSIRRQVESVVKREIELLLDD